VADNPTVLPDHRHRSGGLRDAIGNDKYAAVEVRRGFAAGRQSPAAILRWLFRRAPTMPRPVARRSALFAGLATVALSSRALQRALESRLRVSKLRDRFFDANRPTGSFAAKIDLGYLLGAYHKAAVQSLEGMAGIRNAFARGWNWLLFGRCILMSRINSTSRSRAFTMNRSRLVVQVSTSMLSPSWNG
jgi:hypothetical protein